MPRVLSATRVRENWNSDSPTMSVYYQSMVRRVNGLFGIFRKKDREKGPTANTGANDTCHLALAASY